MTTQTQTHTPGPWVHTLADDGYEQIASEVDGRVVAFTERYVLHAIERSEANARLIAAAPDLLECLRMAVEDLEQLSAPPRAVAIYRDAIRKATNGDA